MALGMALLAGVAAAQDTPALKNQKVKRSYALGMSLGNSLRKQSVELDLGLLIQGLKDALRSSKTLHRKGASCHRRGTARRAECETDARREAARREKPEGRRGVPGRE